MNPFSVSDTDSEALNQAALFSWLSMVQAFGVAAANDPRSYTEAGHAKTVGFPQPDSVRNDCELVHGIMNGLELKDARSGAAAKASGLRPGIPDIFVPIRRGSWSGLYIELKTPKGTLRKSQEKMIPLLQAQGFMVKICIGWRQASVALLSYLLS
jgi:hypothetical protein